MLLCLMLPVSTLNLCHLIVILKYLQPPHVVPVVTAPKIEETVENSKSSVETSEEEEERLKVWRSHILEENVNTKRTRARACKGQRYREFMWTSFANRRRSNR